MELGNAQKKSYMRETLDIMCNQVDFDREHRLSMAAHADAGSSQGANRTSSSHSNQ
jgi:hypothetical protein